MEEPLRAKVRKLVRSIIHTLRGARILPQFWSRQAEQVNILISKRIAGNFIVI